MNTRHVLAALLLAALTTSAQDLAPAASTPALAKKPLISYKPPKTGAPNLRVSQGTRSAGEKNGLRLTAVTPAHSGLTLREQPVLYWHQSKAAQVSVELYLTELPSMKTVLELKLKSERPAGLQHIDLAQHGAKLQVGKRYEWSIAIAGGKADAPVATGAIERIAAPKELAAQLVSAAPAEAAALLAAHGIWYDAFAAISALVERDPGHAAARAALLQQIGLGEIAK